MVMKKNISVIFNHNNFQVVRQIYKIKKSIQEIITNQRIRTLMQALKLKLYCDAEKEG